MYYLNEWSATFIRFIGGQQEVVELDEWYTQHTTVTAESRDHISAVSWLGLVKKESSG